MKLLVSSPPLYEDERKLIGFMIGDVVYGIDIMQVREIVNPLPMIQLPTAPKYVVGVADHREAVVPVVDLRIRFDLSAAPPVSRRTKWIIVKTGVKDVGLLVDLVIGVIKVSTADRRESHPLLAEPDMNWICEVYGTEDVLVFELDLDAVAGPAAFVKVDRS